MSGQPGCPAPGFWYAMIEGTTFPFAEVFSVTGFEYVMLESFAGCNKKFSDCNHEIAVWHFALVK
jgi:hypothetical protein